MEPPFGGGLPRSFTLALPMLVWLTDDAHHIMGDTCQRLTVKPRVIR